MPDTLSALFASIRRRPLRWSAGLLLVIATVLAVLLHSPLGLPHAPSFVFVLPITVAALASPPTGAAAMTGLAVLAHLGLEATHPAGQGLTVSVMLRALALLCVGAVLCGLGLLLRRSRARSRASLEAYREAAALHRRSEERLRSLLAREHSAEQRERHRIARELHDDLQQRLAAISLELAALRQQMPRDGSPLDEGLKRATTMTVDAIVATRRIVSGLRPRALDELGLAAALQQLGKDFAARTGIDCEVLIHETPSGAEELTPVEADCLYRVAQEALQNVEKHAGAHTVRVRLTTEVPGLSELEIVDDGIGLDEHALDKPASLGLLGMEERAREIGGSLEVGSAEGGGTVVRARLSRPAG
jgi:signal transduction histidine kinase